MSQAVPHESDQPVRAYIEAKLSDERAIARLRDDIFEQTGASAEEYRRSEPHLTILPPFTIDASKSHLVDDLIEESGLLDRPIPVEGVGVWPSLNNPRVILLDTPVDIKAEREQLMEDLRDLGATDFKEPVCPHITLFKTDNGYEVSDFVTDRIREAIWDNRESWTTSIEYVDFTVVERLAGTSADD